VHPELASADDDHAELTTVAEDEVVVHLGTEVRRYRGLQPDTVYRLDGVGAATLPRPPGQLLAVVATVNDVHFGETECGLIEGMDIGPVLRSEPDEPPYPDTMNAGAVAEIAALRDGAGPDAVVAKGDLTTHGTAEEYEAFLACYRRFGGRLHHVRGNHDAQLGEAFAATPTQEVVLEGATLAIVDTTIPQHHTGRVLPEQLEWLDELGARADRPVLVFGHHHPWDPGSGTRSADYFGINPDDSEALVEVLGRRRAFAGYFAGHTHRNRVRHFTTLPGVPVAEVASVKDFPGAWAEYRVFEGGILQVLRRVSTRAALTWTNRTRRMFHGVYAEYSFGTLADRCFPIRPRAGA
jgi:3',5'-cyclic-AMP phosphodiesterase